MPRPAAGMTAFLTFTRSSMASEQNASRYPGSADRRIVRTVVRRSGQRSQHGTLDPVMPTYEYVCRSCGHLFEIVQSMRDDTLTECPQCGGELRKVFAPPAISFKGSGFYATDHGKNKTKTGADTGDAKSAGSSDAKSDASRTRSPPRRRRDAKPAAETKKDRRPRARRRPRRMRAARELGRHRSLRRVGLLLVPRRHRDRRGRDAVRLAERRRSRSARSAVGGWRSCPATARGTSTRRTGSRTRRTCGR